MLMSNLQIKGIEESLYRQIKELAVREHRSISQQVLFLVKDCLAKGKHLRTTQTQRKCYSNSQVPGKMRAHRVRLWPKYIWQKRTQRHS